VACGMWPRMLWEWGGADQIAGLHAPGAGERAVMTRSVDDCARYQMRRLACSCGRGPRTRASQKRDAERVAGTTASTR
jgi:hypothetical protein